MALTILLISPALIKKANSEEAIGEELQAECEVSFASKTLDQGIDHFIDFPGSYKKSE